MRSRPAASLLEILIVLGLFVTVAGILSTVFYRTYQTHGAELRGGEQQLDTRLLTERFGQMIRPALNVTDSYTTYTSDANRLILRLASLDAQQNIIPNTYDYAIYQANPTAPHQLQEIIISSPQSSRPSHTRVLTDQLSTLVISYEATNGTALDLANRSQAERLTLTITFSDTNDNQIATYTLRNK